MITYAATDSSNVVETQVTNSGNNVSTATPTFTVMVDLTPPTVTCTPPAPAWQATDVVVPCVASDNAGGSGLVGPSSFSVQTNVPLNTETNAATIPPVTVKDVAGNTSTPQPSQGSFGPFEVDKKPPVINGPTISPASPVYGQSVTASYECTDGGSGVVVCGPAGSPQIPPTSDTGTLTSSANGSVGTQTFTVTAQDLVGNTSQPSSITYTVGKATPTVTWSNPAPIVYGTPLSGTQLNATANIGGGFAYSPASGTVLTAGTQTLSATFTPSDTTDYNSVTTSVTLVVNKAIPTITWATPAPITYGTQLSAAQLNASANVPGSFVYTPQAGTVLTAGTQTLSVTFTPTDATDYASATATVQLTVNKASPAITWPTPSPITYGTPLSSVQLDASANVPGTFAYTPGFGTVLTAGRANALGDLYTERHHRLHDCNFERSVAGEQGAPNHYMAYSIADRLWDTLEFNSTRCHREYPRNLRLHTASRNRSSAWQSDAVRSIHSKRFDGLLFSHRIGDPAGHTAFN